ncbi:MAG: T9SS type A sorting domain-containing protein [Candidatus Marinimicrobia bacterium]|nr:T9SS type A sorting domain-containing protein [Candidatus Neomarinimicrobiota bacterium]
MQKLLIILLLFSPLLGEEWTQWDILEYGDIAFHPDSSNILYLGTTSNYSRQRWGALMVSYDNGNTLDTLFKNLSIAEIEFHPFSSDTLFLAVGSPNYTRPGVLKVIRYGVDYDTTWIDAGITLGPEISVYTIEIDPVSPDTMFAGTIEYGAGHIYRTTDGGLTWSDANPGYSNSVRFIRQHPVNPNEIYYTTGWVPRLHRSFDWGETWSEHAEWSDDESISSIAMFPEYPGRILVTVAGVGIYISNNYGDSWDLWNEHSPSLMASEIIIDPNNPTHLYLATTDSVFFSDDFGESWSDYTFNISEISFGLQRLTYDSINNRLFAGSYWSGLYSLDLNTVAIDREDLIELGPNRYKITKIYPNPFNPSTTIQYDLPENSDVSLVIYDVTGREVKNLVSKMQSPGSYNVSWDGSGRDGQQLAGGMYFARLQAGEYSSVVKMVYLR